jgi:hypothetical protein
MGFPPFKVSDESDTQGGRPVFEQRFADWVGLFKSGVRIDVNPYRILINHIGNPEAWKDTSGYSRYDDGAVASPVDGAFGTPNVAFEFNRTTVAAEVQRGVASFEIVKDANNRQGHGVSYDFTIDNVDQGKTLEISFDYETTANYANDDVGVYIYDITNATIINPADINIQAASSGSTFATSFAAAANSTSYRIIFHVQSVSALAYDLFLDNIRVGPAVGDLSPAGAAGAGQWVWQDFTTSGNWVAPAGVTRVITFACGGGGGGDTEGNIGNTASGGGGGSHPRTETLIVVPTTNYTITVGAGGAAGPGSGGPGVDGGASSFGSLMSWIGGDGGPGQPGGVASFTLLDQRTGGGDGGTGPSAGGNGDDSLYASGGTGGAQGAPNGSGGGGGGAGLGDGADGGFGSNSGAAGDGASAAANSGAGGGGSGSSNSGGPSADGGDGGSGRVMFGYWDPN